MTQTQELPDPETLVGRWQLKLVSAPTDSREVTDPVEIEFDEDGSYVIRSRSSDPIAGVVDPEKDFAVRTVASGISLPARALRVEGDTLYWTMSDGADLVFSKQADPA